LISAAFDTIDHSILLSHLSSWFGINKTALAWIGSNLSNRSFYVSINGSNSPVLQFNLGVPQGSVLGPLLFIIYTTPLSTLICDSSVSHHPYADNMQLFLSVSATNFSENILLLQETISQVSSWIVSNLLSLKPSKTGFLLIGLPKQLAENG
jgi:hypothetical protein